MSDDIAKRAEFERFQLLHDKYGKMTVIQNYEHIDSLEVQLTDLRAENTALRNALSDLEDANNDNIRAEAVMAIRAEAAEREVLALRSRCDALTKALTYYADDDMYQIFDVMQGDFWGAIQGDSAWAFCPPEEHCDNPSGLARQALAATPGETARSGEDD